MQGGPLFTRTNTILLRKLRDTGDQTAWEAFDARYRPVVLAVARRLGLRDADAEDAAQEAMAAFAQAYRQGKYDRQKGRLRDWLLGIARHKIQDVLRRRRRKERIVSDQTDGTGLLERVEDERLRATWDDEWGKAVLRQCLAEIRNEVAPLTFEAFTLFALQQWPAKRVAAHLQVSEDLVYKSKSRILARIRRMLPEMERIW